VRRISASSFANLLSSTPCPFGCAFVVPSTKHIEQTFLRINGIAYRSNMVTPGTFTDE
jgi:hypothetical protein